MNEFDNAKNNLIVKGLIEQNKINRVQKKDEQTGDNYDHFEISAKDGTKLEATHKIGMGGRPDIVITKPGQEPVKFRGSEEIYKNLENYSAQSYQQTQNNIKFLENLTGQKVEYVPHGGKYNSKLSDQGTYVVTVKGDFTKEFWGKIDPMKPYELEHNTFVMDAKLVNDYIVAHMRNMTKGLENN